jgi:hypothetical protein
MLGVAGVFALLLILTAVVMVVARALKLRAGRRQGMAEFAGEMGFHFSDEDPVLTTRWAGAPFGCGKNRKAANVVTGRRDGRQVVAFDYSYSVEKQGTQRFAVVAISLQTGLPWLEVTAAGLQLSSRVKVEVESERFNDEFAVRSDDARYGHAVLHPRMLELLLNRGEIPWRIEGSDLIGWAEGTLEPGAVLPRMDALAEIAALIPPFVWADYGRDRRLG